MFDRIEKLIGKENLKKIKKAKVLLVGLGGVGGSCLEVLVRSGVTHITVVDSDIFEDSNLNRQILSNINVIGSTKANVAKAHSELINPDVKITAKKIFLDKDSIKTLPEFDYIIDACDTTDTKVELIKYAILKKIKIISSMGMGNRKDPSKIVICKLSKTHSDPLAKKIRNILRKDNIKDDIDVVCSTELPKKNSSNIISSMMMVPSVAGIYLAYYVIEDIIKNDLD